MTLAVPSRTLPPLDRTVPQPNYPRPVVLLDVDGVLNALGKKVRNPYRDFKKEWVEFPPDAEILAYTFPVTRIQVTWSPKMVKEIWELREWADIVWLTTWGEMANRFLVPLFGWEPLIVLQEPHKVYDIWWKSAAAQHFIESSPRRFVWVDDDLPFAGAVGLEWVNQYPRHLVAPSSETGLLPEQVERIRKWVQP